MNSLGTGLAKAAFPKGDRSRESPMRPTSFSSWTMITRWVLSTSRTWRIKAAKARASASQLFWPRVESTSTDLPSVIWARGNRSWLAFTQGGAKLESPFFQLANHSHAIRTLFCRAPSMAASAMLKSYLLPRLDPVPGHARQDGIQVNPFGQHGHTPFMYSRLEEMVLFSSPERARKGCRPQ